MFIGIISVLLFQSMTSAHPHDEPKVKEEVTQNQESLFSDSFFNDDPFQSMQKMRERMLKNFNSFDGGFGDSIFDMKFDRSSMFDGGQKSYTMSSRETDSSLIYEIELESGVEGDSVNVSVENGMVTISGQKTTTNKDENNMGQSIFSSSSSFSQSFSIPNHVDSENVKITNEDKKIILTFPKGTQEV